MGGSVKSWVHGTCNRFCHESRLTLSVIGMGVHAVCPLYYAQNLLGTEVSAAFLCSF